MDSHIRNFYCARSDEFPHGNFHDVIVLHEKPELSWSDLQKKAPKLIRGWYELAQLSAKDRLEFTQEFWFSKIPFHLPAIDSLNRFFAQLEDISIFLVQHTFDSPYEPQMVYSCKDGKCFFRGLSPATEESISTLKEAFPQLIFPTDYLAFLQIHDGFSKTTDTGITNSQMMKASYDQFQGYIAAKNEMIMGDNNPVDPLTLVPFYESFGMPFFQCFWLEWYPEDEMGNVYYSGKSNAISSLASKDPSIENMAFKTFADWLVFYLETLTE